MLYMNFIVAVNSKNKVFLLNNLFTDIHNKITRVKVGYSIWIRLPPKDPIRVEQAVEVLL